MNLDLLKRLKLPFFIAIPCLLTAMITQYVVLPHTDTQKGWNNYELVPQDKTISLYVRVPALVTEHEEFEVHFYFASAPSAAETTVFLRLTGRDIDPLIFNWAGAEDSSSVPLRAEHAGPFRLSLEGSIKQRYSIPVPPGGDKLFGSLSREINMVTIPIEVAVSPRHRVEFGTYIFAPLYLGALAMTWVVLSVRRERQALAKKLADAESKAEAEPEKSKYAWDAARINLEAYFERNRLQVAQVFVIAVIVMSIGFILVCFGVFLAMTRTDTIKPALVAGISGIITQFIGATFMIIYRSTMTQANEFMVILERINTVGMAIQVLDLIPESEITLKNESRAKIVELLLNANVSTSVSKTKKSKAATA